MSQKVAIGRAAAAAVTTAVKQILPLNRQHTATGYPRKFVLLETDVDTYLVTAPETVDGGALPASGYIPFDATDRLVEYDISGAAFLGLAGSGAGTVRFELR